MNPKIERAAEIIFFVLVFLLINIRSFVFWTLFPDAATFTGIAWREIPLWSFALILMVCLLSRRASFRNYLDAWQEQPVLITFILFCIASVFWSSSWMVTLHRSLVFVFASMAAAYMGVRYSLSEFFRLLFWFCSIAALASLVLVLINPKLGTDLNHPYNGAWRGIYWHKNHLGNLTPFFALVFLFQAFRLRLPEARLESVLSIPMYILCLLMAYKTDSVSAFIILLTLHGCLVVVFLWLKFRDRLHNVHYYFMLGAVMLIVMVLFANVDHILGLFNRDSSLTGRVPLWAYLLEHAFMQRAWLGYGFGTIWSNSAFRIHIRDVLGWGYPVMIGDNGFIDILLNLGIIGFILFLAVYLQGWIKSVRYALSVHTLAGFAAPVFMLYTLMVNISFSLFMETEVLIWTVFVTLLFVMRRREREQTEKVG
jgi:O-antigen ligase